MVQVNKKTLNVRGRLIDLSEPRVMGILNITPDSFYERSRVGSLDSVLERVGLMADEGATFIDIGGYSTRPGAGDISINQEIERIGPILGPVSKYFPDLSISIDTFRSEVAKFAVREGAAIINDVSGGNLDDDMLETVSVLGVPYVLMHMRGTPQNMAELTAYNKLVPDILRELKSKLDILVQNGVPDIIIDPGFGFAKSIEQNFQLLDMLSEFDGLARPLLVGLSRKGTIYKTLDTTPADALNGTTVLNTIALEKGASILRVHDVKAATEAVKLWKATKGIN